MGDIQPQSEAVTGTVEAPLVETAPGQPALPSKKGLPIWVVLVVVALCLGGVYLAYTKLLKEPPPTIVHKKKA